jgi:uncharacterized membrane protein YdbT with pleckstrin-like domain
VGEGQGGTVIGVAPSRTMTGMSDLDDRLISGEKVVFSTAKHWFALVADSKWAILMIIVALAAAWLQSDATSGIGGFLNRSLGLAQQGLWLGALAWIAYNAIAWRSAEYHVTNRRVLGQEGLIRRRTTDTLLTSIADVKTAISAIGRMLGYGNIRILTSSGGAGADDLTAVRDVQALQREILEQKTGASAGPPLDTSPASSAASSGEITATLGELAKLRDAGAITVEEFDAKKAELLRRI